MSYTHQHRPTLFTTLHSYIFTSFINHQHTKRLLYFGTLHKDYGDSVSNVSPPHGQFNCINAPLLSHSSDSESSYSIVGSISDSPLVPTSPIMPPVIAYVPHNNLSMTGIRATEQCRRLCGDQSNYRLVTRGYQPWPVAQTEKRPAINNNERPRTDTCGGEFGPCACCNRTWRANT